MPDLAPARVGKRIKVRKGLRGHCPRHGPLVTNGKEGKAPVVAETFFDGRFTANTGCLAVSIDCPLCGYPVQFTLPGQYLNA